MSATQELLNQGRYRIEHQFGATGDSTAFSAYDTVSNVNVVVKEIPLKMSKVTTLSQQENSKLAFTNQAQSLKDLRHEYILNVEDYFFDVGRQYLVLESLEGENLQAILQGNRGPIELGKAASWSDQILNALEFLGSRTVDFVHGKINPGNVYLTGDGRVKLVSVGVSGNDEVNFDTSVEQAATESANLCYSPLEQIWDGLDPASQKVISNSYDEGSGALLLLPPDGRSDVYSVGAVFYHLITGRQPVDALERSIEMLDGNPDPLEEPLKLNPEIPEAFSGFVLKALEVRRENRYDSPAVMRQALKTTQKLIEEKQNAERREEEEAANDLKLAAVARQEEVQRALEAKKQEEVQRALEAKERELEKEMEKLREEKLRAAEEQRLAAEKRAIAAERLLLEQETSREALAAKHAADVQAENDLLQLAVVVEPTPTPTINEVSATTETDEILTEITTSSVAKEDPAVEVTVPIETRNEPALNEVEAGPVVMETVEIESEVEPEVEVVQTDVQSADTQPVEETSFGSFSYEAEEDKKPLPLAMIAGAAVAVIIFIIGGLWAAGIFGSGTPTPAAQQAVTVPAEIPAKIEEPTPEVQPDTQQGFGDNPQSTKDPAAQTTGSERPAAAATPKPKKPVAEPVKPKAEPKKVTVDDLIN